MALYNPAWLGEVNGIGRRRHPVSKMRLRYIFAHTLQVILHLLLILSNIKNPTGERSSQDEPEKLRCAGRYLVRFQFIFGFDNPSIHKTIAKYCLIRR